MNSARQAGSSALSSTASSGPTSTAGPRIEFLDGVRAVAALFVVVHHCWLMLFPEFPRQTGPWFFGWMLYGHLAVSVFIVLSGFSLSIAPERSGWTLPRGARGFLFRRAWRILPTYWAALALSCIVYGLVTPEQTGDAVSAKAIVVHGVLLQDVIDSAKPNGAFWSIAVEWQIYFLFPLLLLLLRRTGPLRLVALTTGSVVLGYELAAHYSVFARFLNVTPQYVALFAMGIAGAALAAAPTPARRRSLVGGGTAIVALLVVLATASGSVSMVDHFFWVDLLAGGATSLLVAGMAAGGARPLARLFASTALVGTGRFSYSIYCVHAPVIWLVWHFGVAGVDAGRTLKLVVYLAVALPVVLFSSWAFSLVFEKPFLKRRSWAAWRRWTTDLVSTRSADPNAELEPAPRHRAGQGAPRIEGSITL